MQKPGALIFVNKDLNDFIKETLTNQFLLDETISQEEFKSRMVAVPTYVDSIHGNHLRILVILTDFQDQSYRELADLVLFISHGLAYVEKNNVGEPGLAVSINEMYLEKFLRYNDKLPKLPNVYSCSNIT